MSAADILIIICAAGAFGGILDVLQLIDIRRVVEQTGKVISSPLRFLAALFLGGISGSGGALAMLFILVVDGKIEKLTYNAEPVLYLISLGMISGFLGYRLLRSVATRVEKQIQEVEERTERKLKETEIRVESGVEYFDAIASGLTVVESKEGPRSDYDEVIKKLEMVRKRLPDDRRVGITLGRLYAGLQDFSKAIEVLTEVLRAKEEKGTGKDKDAGDLFYNRACYFNLMADKVDEPKKTELKNKAYADLEASIDRFPENKKDALEDPDFKTLYAEERFRKLTSNA